MKSLDGLTWSYPSAINFVLYRGTGRINYLLGHISYKTTSVYQSACGLKNPVCGALVYAYFTENDPKEEAMAFSKSKYTQGILRNNMRFDSV